MNQIAPVATLNPVAPDAGASQDIEDRFAALDFAGLVAVTESFARQADHQTVIRLYQRWIRGKGATDPASFAAWFNLGTVFTKTGETAHAIACYEAALIVQPGFAAAAINLGLLLEGGGRHDDAIALWRRCLQPIESRTALLNNSGRLCERMGRLAEAEQDLRSSLLLKPDQPDVIQHWVHLRQKLCLWPVLGDDVPGLDPAKLLRQAGPLAVLALTDDIAVQREAGAAWVARKTIQVADRMSPGNGYAHDRIRIGYLSSDFCRHAMSYLIAELFERHDRTRFEVFGYCNSPDDGSSIRERILAAFDTVRSIRTLSDRDAAGRIREDEIDILIDLNGLTAGSRPQVLRHRPAPVQATYLGFVGPVPIPELDYMLCDPFVVPPDAASGYWPAPLSIGPLYQANDSRRDIGPAVTRAEIGLPDDSFVLCCFSNHYKITAEMFADWLSILRDTPRAVLWLADDGSGSREILYGHAVTGGLDPNRLIFTGRVAPADYLARLRLADLFLDTFPYGAGTVASDALRMNVPLVTRAGASFASRMAARLLMSVGASDGIAHCRREYIETVRRLASSDTEYAAYKGHFTDEAWRGGPGDMTTFTASFEAAMTSVVRRPA